MGMLPLQKNVRRSSRLRFVLAVTPFVVCLLACEEVACGTTWIDAPPPATCDVVDTECDSDLGLPPELEPSCNPDLREYDLAVWEEPNTPSDPLPVASVDRQEGPFIFFRFGFAPDHRAASGRTAWLTDDEDLEFAFSLAYGADATDPGVARFTLLIDGIVQPFEVDSDGALVRSFAFPLQPGDIVRRALRVPRESIGVGAHSAHLIMWNVRGFNLFGTPFTVLKNDARFLDRLPALAADVVEVRGTGTGFTTIPTGPNDQGELRVPIVVSPGDRDLCASMLRRIVVVAFLDNEQIEVGEMGLRPTFDLRVGEGVLTEVTFRNLPTSEGHILQMWALRDGDTYTEAPLGQLSPWFAGPRFMGRVSW